MIYYDDDLEEEREPEPRELPEVHLDEPGPCGICGKPDQQRGCFRCGRPVCMDESNYMADSACGGWILSWCSNGAMDPDDGNEFWCKECIEEELAAGQSAAGAESEGSNGARPV